MPVDPQSYDRTVALSVAEAAAIDSVTHHRFPVPETKRGLRIHRDLARLLQPLQDVLSVTKSSSHIVRISVLSFTLREMGRHQVPTHKTGSALTSPVAPAVGEAIRAWEKVRPAQPASIDYKTGEVVHFLFFYRGHKIGASYLHDRLIPLLLSEGRNTRVRCARSDHQPSRACDDHFTVV
jgi:hypothetical protein